MAKNNLTQCAINKAEESYKNGVEAFENGRNLLCEGVSSLIKTMNQLDYNLLKLKRQMQIIMIDGEEVAFYTAKSVEVVADDDSIIVIADDETNYEDDVELDLFDLSYEEIYCLGTILFEQYNKKYGNVMTYKDMIEASKKIV